MRDNKKKVRLYSLSTCPACKRTKEFLDTNGISYDCITVDSLAGSEQWVISKEVKKYNPAGSYPTIVIEEVITGFDEAGLREALAIK